MLAPPHPHTYSPVYTGLKYYCNSRRICNGNQNEAKQVKKHNIPLSIEFRFGKKYKTPQKNKFLILKWGNMGTKRFVICG
jgi:hypothetical protein